MALAKYKKEVQSLHDRYCPKNPSEALLQFADKALSKISLTAQGASKKHHTLWCPHCGMEFSADIKTDERGNCKCPHCKKPIKVTEWSRNTTSSRYNDYIVIEELTTCKGWQIDRYWFMDYHFHKGDKPKRCLNSVGYERWFNPTSQKAVLLGKYVGMFPYMRRLPFAFSHYDDCEVYAHSSLQMEGAKTYDYYSGSYYNTNYGQILYPRQHILPEYKRMGLSQTLYYTQNHKYITISDILLCITKTNALETIIKTGCKEELEYFLDDRLGQLTKYWNTFKIARRHGYKYWKHKEYCDLLSQLETLNLDMRNPYYICPTNFKQRHNELSQRITALRERERRLEQEKRELESYLRECKCDKDYIKARSKYFGLVISNANWIATPLKNVREFLNEGLKMHHCVYACKYYDMHTHPNSLILSVRHAETNAREVTVEIDLKTMKIMQCYAIHDGISKYDKDIRKLINGNMDAIKEITNNKKRASV